MRSPDPAGALRALLVARAARRRDWRVRGRSGRAGEQPETAELPSTRFNDGDRRLYLAFIGPAHPGSQ